MLVVAQLGRVQGDREDRTRIRQQAERQKKRAAAQQEADELAMPCCLPQFYLTSLQDTPWPIQSCMRTALELINLTVCLTERTEYASGSKSSARRSVLSRRQMS